VPSVLPGGTLALLTGNVGTGVVPWAADELGGYLGRMPEETPFVKAGIPDDGV